MEKSLLQKAILRGWLSQAQLEECAAEKKKTGGQNVLDILVKKGYLNTEQIIRLSQEEAQSKEEEEPFLTSEQPEVKLKPVEPVAPPSGGKLKLATSRTANVLDSLPSVEEIALQPKIKGEKLISLDDPAETTGKLPAATTPAGDKEGIAGTKQSSEAADTKQRLTDAGGNPVTQDREQKDEKEAKTSASVVTPFGKTAILLHLATQREVDAALAVQAREAGKKLGEIMIAQGTLNPQQVKTILSRQESKTMACPKCQKKYQIVLFQVGRSYQCKTCQMELVDSKKLKSKKNTMAVPKKLQVMGLTQAISISSLQEGKPAAARLDFMDEQPATQAASPAEQQVVTTEKLLKQVGWDVPEIPNYTKRPQVQKQRIAPYVTGGIMLCALVAVIFFIIVGNRRTPTPVEPTPTNTTRQTQREKEMHEQYQKLSSCPVKDDDERDLRRAQEDWEEFAKEYVDNPYRAQTTQKLQEIRGKLDKLNLRREWGSVSKKVNAMLQDGNYTEAMAHIAVYQNKVFDEDIAPQINTLKQQVIAKDEEAWHKTSTRASELEKQCKFREAMELVEKSKTKHLAERQQQATDKISALKQAEDDYNWAKVANEVVYKIYPSLVGRHYGKAVEMLAQYQATHPAWNKTLAQWSLDIQAAQKMGETLQKVFEEARGKTIRVQMENGTEIEGKLLMINFKNDSLVFEHGQNKVEYAPFRKLGIETFRAILGDNLSASLPQRIGLLIFLLPVKTFRSLKGLLPELTNDTFYQQMFAFYLLPMASHYFLNGDPVSGEETLQELTSLFRDSLAFRHQREGLAEKLSDYARKLKEAGKNKNAATVAGLIQKYLPDTQAAGKLK
jgi:hypothetical protein